MPVVNTSPLMIVRLVALVLTCVAFSLVVHKGGYSGGTGSWCMFCWCFSFSGTLLILLLELFGLQTRAPVSWRNFPITFAMFATLFCLSASIIYPLYYLNGNQYVNDEVRDYRIAAEVFSCLAVIAYVCEVSMSRARPGEVTGYMATAPGLLKVCETFIACVIFVFISNPVSYDRHEGLKWCLAVYCICFILSAVVIVLCVGECTNFLPIPFNRFLSGYALLAVLMYATATVIWPIYNFDKKYAPYDSPCGQPKGLCPRDKLVAIAVLTALNFLLYLADLFYSARLIFIKV
ncbi:myeloid-associated differentiation marker homolog [Erpetoichthys calabaricus]|uniref:myeloid-associated differentiation marker homolog n=1 Tax=Erpetoichthys calabaricus TaxID=27687 RepID=UPI0022345787|nr:myeloid-associated differentiation marker homolog [Erpetoichthys calabaricus]